MSRKDRFDARLPSRAYALVLGLGMRYDEGDGVPQDYSEALRWYRLAAAQGYTDGQWHVGLMYKDGTGVPRDCAEAVKWHRMASDRGNAYAQFMLGVMYDDGNCVAKDLVLSYMWFSLSAAGMPPGGPHDLAVRSRDKLAAKMTATQLAESRRLVREWKPQ